MQRKVAGALLIALAFGLAACGSASKPLTAAQLRVRASAICRDTSRRVQALQANATQATLHAALARAAVVLSDGLDRLEALAPPDRLADRYDRFLAWKGTQRDAARALSKPGGRPTARERRAVEAHESPLAAVSQQLGLRGC